ANEPPPAPPARGPGDAAAATRDRSRDAAGAAARRTVAEAGRAGLPDGHLAPHARAVGAVRAALPRRQHRRARSDARAGARRPGLVPADLLTTPSLIARRRRRASFPAEAKICLQPIA